MWGCPSHCSTSHIPKSHRAFTHCDSQTPPRLRRRASTYRASTCLSSSASGNALEHRHSLSIFEDSVLESFLFCFVYSQVLYDFCYCRGDPFLNFIFLFTVAGVQKLPMFLVFLYLNFLLSS